MVFYHGTARALSPGDRLLPPLVTGVLSEKGRRRNLDRVFFTADLGSARIYAGRAAKSLGGTPRILVVEPLGDVVCLNSAKGSSVYHAAEAKVIAFVGDD